MIDTMYRDNFATISKGKAGMAREVIFHLVAGMIFVYQLLVEDDA